MASQSDSESSNPASELALTVTRPDHARTETPSRQTTPLFPGHLLPTNFVDSISNSTFTESPVHLHYNNYNFTIHNRSETHSHDRPHSPSSSPQESPIPSITEYDHLFPPGSPRQRPQPESREPSPDSLSSRQSFPQSVSQPDSATHQHQPRDSKSPPSIVVTPPGSNSGHSPTPQTSIGSLNPATPSRLDNSAPTLIDPGSSTTSQPNSQPQQTDDASTPNHSEAENASLLHKEGTGHTPDPAPAKGRSPFVWINNAAAQVYGLGHLFLPSVYRSRVKQVISESGLKLQDTIPARNELEAETGWPPPLDEKLQGDWNRMIDNFAEEWKTLSILSAMLVPGILTLLQLPEAGTDPITRSLSFFSLTQGLWSFVFCCLYIIKATRMRSKYTMVAWRFELASQKKSNWFWNVWVMLAIPVVTLAWSVIVFMAAVIWYLWRSQANPPQNLILTAPLGTEWGFRVAISVAFAMPLGYIVLATTKPFLYGVQDHERLKAGFARPDPSH